jgi:hypothetical protein
MEGLTYTDLLPLSLPDQALKNIDIYVVDGPVGIGNPTHSSRGLQAQVVPDDAFHRRTGSDAFGDGWNAEAEFHGVSLIANQNTKVK